MTTTPLTYVALGDSLTAGKGDLDSEKRPVGWALRLSRLLAERTGVPCAFTNLAVNRATIADIVSAQVPLLKGTRQDLITLSVGINDIRGAFDQAEFGRSIDQVFECAVATASTVATMTLPNIVSMLPLQPELLPIAKLLMEQANEAIRTAAKTRGVLFVDAWYADEVADPAFWSEDRVHPNAQGHAIIAEAFAEMLLTTSPLLGAKT